MYPNVAQFQSSSQPSLLFVTLPEPSISSTHYAGSTLAWSIANLGASTRKMSYSIDICACENIGAVETLVGSSYTDDDTSADAYPAMPESIPVELLDSSYICGAPSVELGECSGRCLLKGKVSLSL